MMLTTPQIVVVNPAAADASTQTINNPFYQYVPPVSAAASVAVDAVGVK